MFLPPAAQTGESFSFCLRLELLFNCQLEVSRHRGKFFQLEEHLSLRFLGFLVELKAFGYTFFVDFTMVLSLSFVGVDFVAVAAARYFADDITGGVTHAKSHYPRDGATDDIRIRNFKQAMGHKLVYSEPFELFDEPGPSNTKAPRFFMTRRISII